MILSSFFHFFFLQIKTASSKLHPDCKIFEFKKKKKKVLNKKIVTVIF